MSKRATNDVEVLFVMSRNYFSRGLRLQKQQEPAQSGGYDDDTPTTTINNKNNTSYTIYVGMSWFCCFVNAPAAPSSWPPPAPRGTRKTPCWRSSTKTRQNKTTQVFEREAQHGASGWNQSKGGGGDEKHEISQKRSSQGKQKSTHDLGATREH